MKKIGLLAVIGALFVINMTGVSAISKSELLTKLTKAYEINGATYQLAQDKAVLAEEYLNQNELSEADMNYISGKVDEAVAVIKNSGSKTGLQGLSSTTKKEILNLVNEVSNNTKVKATVLADGTFSIKNIDGTTFAEVGKNDFIRQTNGTNIVMVAALISLFGIGLAVRELRHQC